MPALLIIAAALALPLGAAAALLWWHANYKPAPFEYWFEMGDGEPVEVRRTPTGWAVTAAPDLRPVALRAGFDPDALGDRCPLTPADGHYVAALAHEPLRRYFFEIELDDGRVIPAAERTLPLEGPQNFRDLGGYTTTDGRRVAWGKVYRADELAGLTDADCALLQALGIRLFCDLRSYAEVQRRPDRVPEGIEYHHLPVFARDPIGRGRVLFMRRRLDDLFKQLYRTSIIDRGAPVLGNVLRLVADPANLPLVFHCTGGKDRTGITAALLLYICGVPRETIMADYTLTNRAAERMLAGLTAMYGSRTSLGLKPEHLYPLFSARRELIELAFAHIEATYGTVDAYLRGPVGLTEAEIDAIRANLLV